MTEKEILRGLGHMTPTNQESAYGQERLLLSICGLHSWANRGIRWIGSVFGSAQFVEGQVGRVSDWCSNNSVGNSSEYCYR